MGSERKRIAWMPGRRLKAIIHEIAGRLVVGLFWLIRLIDRKRMADAAAWVMRKVGPWLPEHRVGRNNLAAAFPDKSVAQIEQILAGVWDNLGRVGVEFIHLDRIRILDVGHPGPADVTYDRISIERIDEVRGNRRRTLFFSGHLANWEIPALTGAHYKIDLAVLYRRPNISAVSDAVLKMRSGVMGTLIPTDMRAPIRLARLIKEGAHVGVLIDQHFERGVEVTFFGRSCKANPLVAHLARLLDCDIRGIRIVRQPDGHHLWGELTEPLPLPRDSEGKIDVQGTMQAITSVLEGWVREHPEQWLWLHRRWR